MSITVRLLKPLIVAVLNFLIKILAVHAKETKTEVDDAIVKFLQDILPAINGFIDSLPEKSGE